MTSDGIDSTWLRGLELLARGSADSSTAPLDPLLVRCVDVGAADRASMLPESVRGYLEVLAIDPDQSSWVKDAAYNRLEWVDALVSNHKGEATHYATRKAQLGSLREPDSALVARFPDPERFEVVATLPCETTLLADVLEARSFLNPHFLKIDVQGCTQEVLEGAGANLEQMLLLQFEAEVLPLYVGQKLLSDNVVFLENAGFQLLDIRPVYWTHQVEGSPEQTHGRMAFSNVQMFRSPDWVIAQGDPTLVRVAAFLLTCFHHLDLAVELLTRACERFLELDDLCRNFRALVAVQRLPFGRGTQTEWGDL